jgi:NAD(P)-dependent dehydrogenase (short-subunit alcohol dehydrogenase family)
VNVVSPGMIDTPMMARFTGGTGEGRQAAIASEPVGRAGTPEEIAATVLWLCSDMAAFSTGSNVVVEGAQTV